VLNEGQEYSLDFKWPGITETLCLFFQPGFIECATHTFSTPITKQLDDLDPPRGRFEICECLYSRSGRISTLLRQLHNGVTTGQGTSWLEDCFYDVAEAIVELQAKVVRSTEQVPALRAGTRKELYRRLHQGRDYLNSCYDSRVTVASAARAAKLSPAHFHRQFKNLFHQTPMQFLQDRRLAAARRLLTNTDVPITNVCFLVGFESLGSFCSLFRKRLGCAPSTYRKLQNAKISSPEEVLDSKARENAPE
jgi:AraC-like DNA-binding protein